MSQFFRKIWLIFIVLKYKHIPQTGAENRSIRGLLLAQRVSDVFPGISFLIPHYQNIKHIIENWLINRLSAKRKEFPGIV
ncbi:MAG: hypothetical protein A2X19_07240 [Bacteroidetes bacterium GWE2_39_28]|nr:MAG: hypothetical protein A2X19_07240 [Bacteroidetes bacterium GWE2_39_28]OFY11932.1 MAG: hypothetical protein A2X16_01125 [Bacteroidetes bacterium GWF2_39_10]OFZ10161.1 MAG: hypothetical protein A2465_10365 [Bacteroidetes bacterium RIFOXYC2_FULL_39_11]HCT94575.1 hypothetical protein [Rikenellaceae bacterium]